MKNNVIREFGELIVTELNEKFPSVEVNLKTGIDTITPKIRTLNFEFTTSVNDTDIIKLITEKYFVYFNGRTTHLILTPVK